MIVLHFQAHVLMFILHFIYIRFQKLDTLKRSLGYVFTTYDGL